MSYHPLQIMLALLMAVPLHLCCWAGLMKTPASAELGCMACHSFLTEAEHQTLPAAPAPEERHCECCADTLLRSLSPEALTAPQVVLLELPFHLPLDEAAPHRPQAMQTSPRPPLPCVRPPPGALVPLYQLQCSRLI